MTHPATTARRLAGSLLLLAAVAVIATACSGTGPLAYGAPASTAATTTAANAVIIRDFSFQPGVLKVKVGAKVTWTDGDSVAHTVTADDKSFASHHLQPGGSFSFTFTRPGTYAYHCSIHSFMHGSVVVA